uniref:Thyroglobulin type-1 domain-containing protein n=1 Tax=Takifugu rubripes TaxID=31033 RepID=A0A3B5K487_TAKRU
MFPTGPSPCEEERWAATEAHSVYIPSCEPGGAFTTRQCQQGGQCWCVDHTGQELPGTRHPAGGAVSCKISIYTIHTKHFTTSHDCKMIVPHPVH